MSAQLATYGRLARDPRTHETKSGVPMTTATIAVSVEGRGGGEGEEGTLWLQLVGFARQADDLARHRHGDLLSPSGRWQLSRYTTNAGEAREGWQMIVDSVVSSRTVRPGGGRRSGGDGVGRRPPPAARDDGPSMTPSGSESDR